MNTQLKKQVKGGEAALKTRERNQERMQNGAGEQRRMQEGQETPVEQAEEIGETPEEGDEDSDEEGNETEGNETA